MIFFLGSNSKIWAKDDLHFHSPHGRLFVIQWLQSVDKV